MISKKLDVKISIALRFEKITLKLTHALIMHTHQYTTTKIEPELWENVTEGNAKMYLLFYKNYLTAVQLRKRLSQLQRRNAYHPDGHTAFII